MSSDPLALVARVADLLDELGVSFVVGGSFASSFLGEPRTTVDLDVAVRLSVEQGEDLLDRAAVDFYVPTQSAREAIARHDSFNLIHLDGPMKVDVFVLGDDQLDRWQIERRVRLDLPGFVHGLWITSPIDQVLRKLRWFDDGDRRSDRQWRDVIGILRVQTTLDRAQLRADAVVVGLAELVESALAEADSIG